MAGNVATGVPEKQGDWAIDIPAVLEPAIWPECCIYRVPKKLRQVNNRAYTPKLISIGPLHHGSKELKDMEKQKRRYLMEYCHRTGMRPSDLVGIIEQNEVKSRHCYAEASILRSKEFVEMILLDGIFIIELFLRTCENENGKAWENDYILSNPWLKKGIQHDLLLLENQLPFFVLEDLYKSLSDGCSSFNCHRGRQLIREGTQDFPSFLKLSQIYFSDYDQLRRSDRRKKGKHLTGASDLDKKEKHFPGASDLELKVKHFPGASDLQLKVKHFTDLLRYLFCASDSERKVHSDPERKVSDRIDHLYSATKLDEAGVKFKNPKKGYLLDVRFTKHKILEYFPCLNCSWLLNCLPCLRSLIFLNRVQPFLKIPAFEVEHETECVFRNLMALEQCHYPTEAHICNYIMLLDSLINTEKDVDLLVEEKVIVNKLGSHRAVAKLVNRLGHQIVVVNSRYSGVSQDLNEHYENFWNKIMATLTTVYFRDIWRGTATVAGIIFLFLTFWNIFLRHFVRLPAAYSRSGTN